ncbi:hypothetical protein [Pseudomonas sp. H3(2019)]|uniref:hypothetical protein n=1 Tax=Pseudomonas sp. H3(2019) TaxID=2598724 RepID=UPI0011948763|nr:hypothetical protein [Pseudomonas sp. H3(2019)]TVT79306.1 hypothetical protein FPT12_26810 [Pseudomonas sp. H3(2019)]
MKLSESFLAKLASEYTLVSESENNTTYSASYTIGTFSIPEVSDLTALTNQLPKRDRITIEIKYTHTFDLDSLNSSDEDAIKLFLRDIELNIPHMNDKKTALTIKISKSSENQLISIYSIEKLAEFLNDNSFERCFAKINDLSQRAKVLELQEDIPSFSTSLFTFKNKKSNVDAEPTPPQRDEILKNREKITNFANSAHHNFIPDDFNIIVGTAHQNIDHLFKKLLIASSLIYICDYSKLTDTGGVSLKLNGYKTITNDIVKNSISDTDCATTYFDIYSWIYNDGNTIDKIGIARNIISIHLDKEILTSITKDTISSIGSGYQIYLKDNLKQYIEIKNKISESIQKSSEKASDLAKSVGSSFRSSVLAIYSFFFSIFLFRVISGKSPSLEVTKEVYLVFIAFMLISIIICWHTMNELKDERTRLESSYANIKNRYRDLISEKDLERILNKDYENICDLNYIDSRGGKTRVLWGLALFIMFILMTVLRMQSYYAQ